jgi:xylan 1,4-beta-xylosidase
MALGLRSDWQAHLKKVHDACGFRRIRGHGLLDNDMNVILPNDGIYAATSAGPPANPDESKQLHYTFRNVDIVYDYLLSLQMKPVVALSWLPSQLASDGNPCTTWHYRGCGGPPKNTTDFGNLVGALAMHFVERHGVEEVRQWPFELWNEPNCGPCLPSANSSGSNDNIYPPCFKGNMRNPNYPSCGTGGWCLAKYLEVFDETSRQLKAVDAQIPVGGPASQQLGW